jgi:arylsulfatase A-like enzyme
LAHVERTWTEKQYLAIFTADHGESFDANHPDKHHSGSIYTSVLHVPLIIQAAQGRGRTAMGLVSHADLLPTIANTVGIEPIEGWVGTSLVDVLFGGGEVRRTAQYSLRFAPEAYARTGGGYLDIGVRTESHYLMYDLVQGTARLVDWNKDPLERTDLSADFPKERDRLTGLARRKLSWIKARECGLRFPACPQWASGIPQSNHGRPQP